MNVRYFASLLAAAAGLGAPLAAQAQPYAFTKIYEQSFPLPPILAASPSLNDSGMVAFTDGTSIYAGDGGPITTVASIFGEFISLGAGPMPAINDAGNVAFLGRSATLGSGAFIVDSGVASVVAPMDAATVTTISLVELNNSDVVAYRQSNGIASAGVYSAQSGVVTTIADVTGPYSSFGLRTSINDSGAVAFSASLDGGGNGVFVSNSGSVTPIVENTGPFVIVYAPDVNNAGDVAFSATLDAGGTASGLFVNSGGANTPIVDSSGPFQSFGNASLNDNGDVAFFAMLDDSSKGIYTGADPVADKVLHVGDALFGATLIDLVFDDSFNDVGQLAFVYVLDNGQSGVAVATPVPEPAAALLMAASMALVVAYRRR